MCLSRSDCAYSVIPDLGPSEHAGDGPGLKWDVHTYTYLQYCAGTIKGPPFPQANTAMHTS